LTGHSTHRGPDPWPYAGDLSHAATRRQFVARLGGTLVASSAAAGLLAACGGDDKATGTAGTAGTTGTKIGGTLNMLVWAGYDAPKASATFRRQHHVTVRPEVMTGGEDISKLAGGGGRNYSLVTPPIAKIPVEVAAGLLEPVDYNRLANAKDLIPHFASLAQETFAVDGTPYSVPYLWGLLALNYNAKYLPQPPASWTDFTMPKFKNKIAITDVASDNFQCWSEVLGYDPMNMSRKELDKVTQFLIDLKRNQARTFTNTYDDLGQQLASGDIVAVASPLWTVVTAIAKKRGGTTAKWTLLDKGCRTFIDAWALPKDGQNVDTAYAWIDYMIGKDAQSKVAVALKSGTVNKQAVPLMTDESRDLPYDDPSKLAKAPAWQLPTGEGGSVSYSDWINAWKRVAAA
jgi:spermidine/putrescine-binding protein